MGSKVAFAMWNVASYFAFFTKKCDNLLHLHHIFFLQNNFILFKGFSKMLFLQFRNKKLFCKNLWKARDLASKFIWNKTETEFQKMMDWFDVFIEIFCWAKSLWYNLTKCLKFWSLFTPWPSHFAKRISPNLNSFHELWKTFFLSPSLVQP